MTFIERSPLLSGRGHLFNGPKLNFSLFWNCIERSVESNNRKHNTIYNSIFIRQHVKAFKSQHWRMDVLFEQIKR